MKKLGTMMICGILLLCCVSDTYAWQLALGVQYSGVLGSGMEDNEFDQSPGFIGEFSISMPGSWEWVVWGMGGYQTENHVKNSSAKVRFWVPYYTEYRKIIGSSSKFDPYLSIGAGWVMMAFDETEGADNQCYLSAGIGSKLWMGEKMFLQAAIKPYFLLWNDLEQNTGFETHLGIGFGM